MIKKITTTIILILLSTFVFAQKTNQFDANGKRHGLWKKNFSNGNVRYTGTFEHGIEVGVFKFYAITGEEYPVVTKEFTAGSEFVLVKFFTKESGRLKSKGNMKNKLRSGLWTFYFPDGKTVILTEEYKEGVLHGEQKIYYNSGVLTKHSHYKNGKLEGNRKVYSKEGNVIENLTFKEGKMHGPAIIYDANGDIFAKGNYTEDKRTGTWEFMIDGQMVKTDNPYVIREKLENTLPKPIPHDINTSPEKVHMNRR